VSSQRVQDPIFTMNGEPIRNNIIIERSDSFATYIRFRYKSKNLCFKCNLLFRGFRELRNHKREQHSYWVTGNYLTSTLRHSNFGQRWIKIQNS